MFFGKNVDFIEVLCLIILVRGVAYWAASRFLCLGVEERHCFG